MRAIADEVFDLTIALGGTVSGEHGDGIARTEYLGKVYGPLVEVFAKVKRLFDPAGILNPGKKVRDPALGYTLTSNLRFDTDYGTRPMSERLVWDAGGAAAEAERCHGCATCRTLPAALTRMCPVYKATRLEAASPRAKANLLREIAAGRLEGTDALEGLERVADLCVLCESCKLDCPSKVDVPKLMVEAKARVAAEGGSRLWRGLFARLDALSRLATPFAPLVNAMNRFGPVRWLMERVAHIDRRRPLPSLAWRPLRSRLRRRKPSDRTPSGRRVVYFPDVFAAYNEPALGEALVALLECAGAHVQVPPLRGCGILALCYGDPAFARRAVEYNLDTLADLVHQGYDVVVSEPTALLCLREAYGDFVSGGRAAEVAAHSYDACSYLLELRRNGEFDAELSPVPLRLGHHTPCHARALGLAEPILELLREIPELAVEAVEEGCCGIAGSAGVRSDKYDLSMQIGAALFERLGDERLDGAVTPCSTCRMQIEHGTRRTCWHPLHLLAHSALGTPLPKRI
jgi:Fe-S oxidoreductase